MANNIYENHPNFPQRRNRGVGITAYLLDMGPMPPPRLRDIAEGMLDHQAAGLDDNEDENIDPQLQVPQPVPAHNVAGKINPF